MSMTPPLAPDPEPSNRGPILRGVLIGVLVLGLAAGGVVAWRVVDDRRTDPGPSSAPSITPSPSPTPSPSADGPLPATDPALARFYGQKISWRDCGSNQCGTLTVPLDYADPGRKTIRIALLRVPAGDPDQRLGSLVVNPGGPGGSGVDYAAAGRLQFGAVLSDRYDIVGFDPRGVGKSTPLDCAGTEQLDALFAFDPAPDDAAERTRIDELVAALGNGCLARSGDLVRHISTKEAARDMDILRAALGESKLDYLGASYGTFLGATYAEAFPQNVGRFVLDGAVNPALSSKDLALQQGRGFETALRAYVADCVRRGNCFLGDTVDAGTKRIKAFLDGMDTRTLRTSGSRRLTEGTATYGIFLPLYVQSLWPSLTQALTRAMNDDDGTGLLALADYYAGRKGGEYDNSFEVLYAVNCLDHNDFIATDEVPQYFAEFEKASPTFGRFFAFGVSTCSQWPVKSGDRTVALRAKGAPPIVVIGTTRDPATPLIWAQAMAKQLDSGRLITRDGDGHTAFQRGNDCVDDAVEAWLISGKVPKADLRC